jgi:hypothetical protein
MPPAEDEVPKKFYKYRPMNNPNMVQRVEDIVLGNKIFFAAPSTFNDPFDLKPAFSLDATPDVQHADYLRLSRLNLPHYSEAQHNAEADGVMATSLHPTQIEGTATVIQALHAHAMNQVGVFCVSTKPNDILMWSHYADSHKGVCLEFDGLSEMMAHAQKVSYSHKRVPINLYADAPMVMMEKAMLTKSDHWAYEAEWRLLRYIQGPGAAQFRPPSLTGIVLGALASKGTFDTVRKWSAQRANPLAIYRAKTSSKEFELLIAPDNRT